MNRDVIVNKVASKLTAMGASAKDAQKETDRLFARLGDVELEKICAAGEDAGAEKLAQALFEIVGPAAPAAQPEDESDEAQLQIDLLQEVFFTDEVIPPDYDFSAEEDDFAAEEQPTATAKASSEPLTSHVYAEKTQTSFLTPPPAGNRISRWINTIRMPESGKEKGAFIACSVVAIPVSLLMILLVGVLFGAAFVAAFLLIVLFIAAMAAVVAGGTAIALVGMIYGTIELFSTVSVGLYEIGIGITALGATMLCGILLYNAAIRLVPFAIRKLAAFARFTARQLREILKAMKGVFSKR